MSNLSLFTGLFFSDGHMLRVISGQFGGRRLFGPRGLQFRPTLDRVKESIFSVLGEDIVDRNVLDLFCGCGSLGIEALSRGALSATFIDKNKTAIELTRKNLIALGLGDRSRVICRDFRDRNDTGLNDQFNLIFSDPPYNDYLADIVINMLLTANLLARAGILVIERSKQEKAAGNENLKKLKNLRFGQTEVDFYFRP